MDKILQARLAIYDQFHKSSALKTLGPQGDRFAAYYTAMYLIQDTGESVWQHMQKDFSNDPTSAYIEFWGVMQAIVIQQDAIKELHNAVAGRSPQISQGSAWHKLRGIRALAAGHPSRRAHGVPAPQRTFMGRSFGKYNRVQYELWDAATQQTTHPIFNLRKLIDQYDSEASAILFDVLAIMKTIWP
jgi:hypothetical protein